MTDPNEQDCPVCRAPMLWKYLNTPRCPKCNPPKRYLLYPGFVNSGGARDQHWITAHGLARLYGVDIRECEIAPLGAGERFGQTFPENLIPLRPRDDGDYTIPETKPGKFDSLRGLDYSDRALGIAASFKSMLTDCPEGWFTGQLAFHVNSAGAVDRIEELRITSETKTEFTIPAPDSQKPVEKQ